MRGVIKNKVYIPAEDFDEDNLSYFEVEDFNEQGCKNCQFRKDRPCEYCEACTAYNGKIQLWSKHFIKGKNYIALPSANLKRITKITGISFEDYKDCRSCPAFTEPLKWTGKLRQGEIVNDVKSANQVEITQNWLQESKRYGFISAPPRTGKCQTGETLINSEEGFIEFNELIQNEGWEDKRLKISTSFGSDYTSHIYKEMADKTIKIVTHTGTEIEGTPEHPMLVLTPELDFVWKKLEEMEIGDHIVGKGINTEVLFSKEDKVTKNEAKLLGWWIANGSKNFLSSNDSFVTKQVLQIAENEGIRVSIRKNNKGGDNYFFLGGFQQRIESLGFINGSANKIVPLKVRCSSREIIKTFLKCYFECDSGKDGNYISLTSASEKLMRQIKLLLDLVFNIRTEIIKHQKFATNSSTPTKRDYWTLLICGFDAYKFCKEFPTSKVARKFGNNWSRRYYSTQECTNKKYIPYIKKYIKKIYLENLATNKYNPKRLFEGKLIPLKKLPAYLYKMDSHFNLNLKNSKKWMDYIEYIKELNPVAYLKIKEVLSKSENYEKVVSISEGEKKYVYDVCVPESHEFLSNGLVSHNSILGVYLSCTLGVKTLFVAHQNELLENFYKSWERDTNLKELREKTGKKIVGIIEKPKDFEDLDVALVTYQKFIREATRDKLLKDYIVGKFGFLVVDEAHQGGARAYAHFLSSIDTKYKLGLSATPMRKDTLNKILLNVIGPVTVKCETTGLIPRIEILETGIRNKKKTNMWVYTMKALQENPERNKLILRELARDLKEHKCVIIPVDTKAHMDCLLKSINNQFGENTAVGYHSKSENRKDLLKEVDDGKYRVLIAIKSMIKQGIDLLSPTMIYIQVPMSAAPQPKGSPMFYQMGNRVCTPYPGKREPVIKIFIDTVPESYGCFMSLFLKEILPGLKAPEGGRARYVMGAKTFNYCFSIIKRIQKKIYSQNGVYNPETMESREEPKEEKSNNLLTGSWL